VKQMVCEIYFLIIPPFEKLGIYFFAHDRSFVRRSIHPSVRPKACQIDNPLTFRPETW